MKFVVNLRSNLANQKLCRVAFILIYLLVNISPIRAEPLNELPNTCTLLFQVNHPQKQTLFFTESNRISDEEDALSSINLNKEHIKVIIPCTGKKLITISYNNESFSIYIEQGTIIKVFLDTKNFSSSIYFQGSNSKINKYLISKQLFQRLNIPKFESLYALSQTKFDSLNDNSLKSCRKLANKLLGNNSDFKKQDDLDLVATWLNRRLLYPGYHNYFSLDKVNNSPNFDEFTEIIPVNSSAGILSSNYISLLTLYLNHKVREDTIQQATIKKKQIADLILEEYLINNYLKNDDLIKLFIGRLMWKYLELGFKQEFKTHFLDWQPGYTLNEFSKPAIERYKALTTIDSGKIAPNFTFKNLNSVTSKLSDLNGKYIYINVWSLGCHASLDENAILAGIQKKFKNKSNLLFLNVSIDDNRKDIVDFLNKTSLSGINAMADKSYSNFLKRYFITTTPRYILINDTGYVINAFAARPSSPDLLDILQSLP